MTPELLQLLRRRLTLWYAGIFGTILLLFGVGLYVLIERSLLDEQQQVNQSMASSLATLLKNQPHYPSASLQRIEGELREMAKVNSLFVAQIYDAQGHLRASWPPDVGPFLLAGQSKGLTEWENHYMSWASFSHSNGAGTQETFLVGQKMDETYHVLRRLIWVISLGMPCVLLGALVAGSLLAAKALLPIRQTLEQQRRFMADASHELRTPVSILLAQTEVALHHAAPEAVNYRQVLETVHRTTHRMQGLISDLLTLSRADTHSLQLQILQFEVNEWVEDMVTQWLPAAQNAGITFAFEENKHPLIVSGDPDKLSQLLFNLFDNAVKYTPAPGTVLVTVALEQSKWGKSWVCVAVKDTGPGIPSQELMRIFDRFYRVEHTAQIPGSGLGLALAQMIAELHGGKLQVSSIVGQGSAFTLKLPFTEHSRNAV